MIRQSIAAACFRPAFSARIRGLVLLSAIAFSPQILTHVSAQPPGSEAGEFQSQLAEWKSLLKDMRTIQLDYVEAGDAEKATIRSRWAEMVARGNEMLESLRAAGIAAYAEAPGNDRILEQFLIKLVQDDIAHDRYEAAAKLAKSLLELGCQVKEVYDMAGHAAFIVNDYDSAEEYMSKASDLGSLAISTQYYPLLAEYRQYWAEEQKLREQEAAADDLPRVLLKTTPGDIVLELFENEAPETVGNFVSLVEDGFYDGLIFHRVIAGFMAQGGCPLGTGTGGPGYNIRCECYEPDHRKHFRGSLSMAKAKEPNTGGSQFFLTFVPRANLNGEHTVFGRVVEGLDVLAELQRVDPEAAEKPKPDVILAAEVLRKREHAYVPNKVN